MKTIEEKAKRYDEAIERAECIYNEIAIPSATSKGICTYIFPELKESEDDRIKKAIIKCLKWLRDEARWTDIYGISFDSIFACLEKQGEQKPADKVKPRFKVGDWIINTESGYIRQILTINNDCYETDYGVLPIKDYESIFHLWTIKDAKDGDMLTTDTWTFIFKKYQDKSVYYHCAVSTFNDFSISDTGEFDSNYVHPATKEQRDLLFQKMKEAGYEWYADKKELKKIEQNSIEPDNLIEESYQQQADDLIDMVTEKPAWSEEDEKMLNDAIGAIGAADYYTYDDKQEIENWLKSLRPQNTWKPSIAQLNALSIVSKGNAPDDIEAIVSLYNDLKKLRKE